MYITFINTEEAGKLVLIIDISPFYDTPTIYFGS